MRTLLLNRAPPLLCGYRACPFRLLLCSEEERYCGLLRLLSASVCLPQSLPINRLSPPPTFPELQ